MRIVIGMLKEILLPEPDLLSNEQNFKARHPMFEYRYDPAPEGFRKKLEASDAVVVVGMGGSVLPLRVFVEFYRLQRKIYFMESPDPESWSSDIFKLEKPLFCLVSKSGKTLELTSIASFLLEKYELQNFAVVSDPGSPLAIWAQNKELPYCPIPKEIGGRFTNFTPFHCSLLEWAKVSFDKLLKMAAAERDFLLENPSVLHSIFSQIYLRPATSLILWAYGERSYGLALWMQQALAESLGKKSKDGKACGILPVVLRGPQDQHSVLQLLMDGPQDKCLWFLESWWPSIHKLKAEAPFEMLQGQDLSRIMEILAESTFESFRERLNEPQTFQALLRWKLGDSEEALVQAIVRTQALVEYAGHQLRIDPYDQPGVERGKEIARKLLKT